MQTFKNPQLISLTVLLLFLALVSYGNVNEHAALEKIRVCTVMKEELIQNAFGSVYSSSLAKAFSIHDFTTGKKIYGKNDTVPLPLASLTKLMTVRIVLQKNALNDFYTVKKADLATDGSVGFIAGDSYRVGDIIHAALIASSNDAATMLSRSTGMSDEVFAGAMNTEAKTLKLTSMRFANATGLDDDTANTATAFGSASDVLALLHADYSDFTEVIKVSTLPNDTITASNNTTITLKNTNSAIDKLPLLLASKTGYTDIAGGNLAILWREPNGDILGASVLGSTTEGRFSDMVAIHNAANIYLVAAKLIPATCK